MLVDAVLPAAGRIAGAFAEAAGTDIKALIQLGGKTVLERTLETLRATGCIRRTVIIAPPEVARHPGAQTADIILPESDSGPSNVLLGLEWLQQHSPHAARVLVLTTDLPFLTPHAVTTFLTACPLDLDLCVPLIRREAFEARFPGHSIEYVRLRDGVWTMGCAFLVNPTALFANRPHLERIFAARKSQWRMAHVLGPMFILRFLAGRLDLRAIEQRCLEIMGCSGGGIAESPPELAFDIDKPSEYRYAVQQFSLL